MRRAVAFALAAGLLAACAPPPPPASPAGGSAPIPSPAPTESAVPVRVSSAANATRSIIFTEQRNNRVVYTMHADKQTAEREPDGDGTSQFVNPRIRFIGTDGRVLFARAPAGTVTQQAKVVTVLMSGGVHAHTDDGTTLESDTLQYDDANQTIHARGHVVLTTATDRLQGGALDGDIRLSHVELTPGDA